MKTIFKLIIVIPFIISCESWPDRICTYVNKSKQKIHIKEYGGMNNDFTLEVGAEHEINYGYVADIVGLSDSTIIEFEDDRRLVIFNDSIIDIFGTHPNYSLILEKWDVKKSNNRKICQEYELSEKEYNVSVKK